MKYCKACGAPMMSIAESCPKCGHLVSDDHEEVKKKNTAVSGLTIAGLVLAICSAFFCAIVLLMQALGIFNFYVSSLLTGIFVYLFCIPALVFGAISVKNSKSNRDYTLAKAAFVISVILITLHIAINSVFFCVSCMCSMH